MMGYGGMHLIDEPGYFQHYGRQMDGGISAICPRSNSDLIHCRAAPMPRVSL
jgi:hypothetical protein